MTRWIIIDEGLPDPTFTPGWISNTNRKVQCPRCGYKFVQHVESGCFATDLTPSSCKKCGHPWDDIRVGKNG